MPLHPYNHHAMEILPRYGEKVFLLLFIFLPRLIRQAMKTGTETIISVSGRNEQFQKVLWTAFIALASLVLAQAVDPATAGRIVGMIAGVIP
jgi:hypothetical protein